MQSVTCLVTDAKLTADPGVASSIPARSYTFVEIDHEIISTVILLPSKTNKQTCTGSNQRGANNFGQTLFWALLLGNLSLLHANNKGTARTPFILSSAIWNVSSQSCSMRNFDILANFSVAEQADLSMTWLQTAKAVLSHQGPFILFTLNLYI